MGCFAKLGDSRRRPKSFGFEIGIDAHARRRLEIKVGIPSEDLIIVLMVTGEERGRLWCVCLAKAHCFPR